MIRKTKFIIFPVLLFFSILFVPMKAAAADMNSAVGAVTTGGGSLYVRSSPSTGSTVLTALKKGSYVTLIEKFGDWWKVEYSGGSYGYCYAGYLTPVEGKAVRVNTGGDVLNVRTGPSTSYSRIDMLPHSSIVMLRSSANGWSRILYNGTKLGYVSSQYLTGQTAESGTDGVSLSVPSFKQTDKRWASYPLGNRGGNIGTIGCAVTGIAMMESYRTGTTIYPDAMAKKLSFTSGGAVYWPSHYNVSTQKDHLGHIYQLLKQGKPVLLGATNHRGGQHWIVITGFTGGSLTASNFTINDPGSHSRTTLQQFYNSFPNFYKYFYY